MLHHKLRTMLLGVVTPVPKVTHNAARNDTWCVRSKRIKDNCIEDITRRREDIFFFQVAKTIFYEGVRYHEEIKFISSSCRVIFFLLFRQEYFCTNNSVKGRNGVIDILTCEDMKNTPLESRVYFCMNFPLKHSCLNNKSSRSSISKGFSFY